MNEWHFVGAQEMAQLHPDTFEAPDLTELDDILRYHTTIKPIYLNVKACFALDEPEEGFSAERLWVKVDEYDPDTNQIIGEINNEPMLIGSYRGAKVTLHTKHVYDYVSALERADT